MPPTHEEILVDITRVFARVLKQPSLSLRADTIASDVEGWDSLSHVTLISEVEREFGAKFTLREVMRLQNVGDLCALIRTKLGE